ncbi:MULTISPECIES: response regulator [Sorangium]|uniref:Response regulator n=1 Tax=Sorangium atrum TaxID=2995308 RepID=A0ABT5CA06_9BACT|nr:response regulator [Sorangium aterium]MDC0683266.1 response regulator [Sorangium aterium]
MCGKHVILVAEDDVDTATMLEELLTLEGYEVELTATARAVLDALAERRFHAVLLDLTMPGMTTDRFVSEIEGLGTPSPLMIFSARLPHEMQAIAERLHAAALLPKPVDIDVLLGTLSKVVLGSLGSTDIDR